MVEFILDASALLAALLGEPGWEQVKPHLSAATISSLNYSEVLARMFRLTGSLENSKRHIDRHRLMIAGFDAEQATIAASLITSTQPFGLSLADRACLALAISRGGTVLTADRVWAKFELGIDVQLIR